jgi:hypothetical protein
VGNEYRHKIICDPVHSEIPVSELEQKLVDSRSFQRLRNLKQLGLASLVYPNATHTRFAHSLGVFRLMSRVIDLFVDRGHFNDEDRRKLRIAALLHDIGHYPYSHLMEFVDRDKLRPTLLRKGTGAATVGTTAVRYPSHEKIGELIIEKRTDLAEVLSQAGLDPKEIGSMIRGQHTKPAYNRLTHSSLDVDRMDYLVRDSLGTGVPYGHIDLDYILSNLDVVSEPNEEGKDVLDVVLAEKASTAAEHFLVARYFMHKVVYFHKTTFGLEALLRQILFLMREQKRVYADGDAVRNAITDDAQFFAFHDGYVDAAVQLAAADKSAGTLADLCNLLLTRTPPKLLCEVPSLRNHDGQHRNEYVLFRNNKAGKIEGLAAKYGIPKEFWIWEDLPKDVSFEAMGPSIELSQVEDLKPEEAAELIRIQGKDGKIRRLIEDPTSIIHHLSKLKLQVSRLYLAKPVEKELLASIRAEVNSWSKQD